MKKLLASLLMCCLLLAFAAMPALAAQTPGFDLYFTTDKDAYNVGDTVTVQLILERNDNSTEDYSMFLFTDNVIFNTTYLRYVDSSANANNAEGVQVAPAAIAYNATHKQIAVTFMGLTQNITRSARLVVAELQFVALANTTKGVLYHDNAEVGLSAAELCPVQSANGTYLIGQPEPVLYNVGFGAGGGSGTTPAMGPFAAGEVFMLPLPNLAKSGYEFVGWNDGNKTYAAGFNYTMPESELRFTAVWVKVDEEGEVAEDEDGEIIEVILPGQPQYFEDRIPFVDVPLSEWYYNDVFIAYHQGLINGMTDYSFGPDNNLTIAHALKFAACMHQIYTEGKVSLPMVSGSDWYLVYLDYCLANGIIAPGQFSNYNATATRAQFAVIFANALPAEAYTQINTIADGAIPDVSATTYGADAVYKLYRAGITQGSTGNVYMPESPIRRCEVAAILTRMMNEEERMHFSL